MGALVTDPRNRSNSTGSQNSSLSSGMSSMSEKEYSSTLFTALVKGDENVIAPRKQHALTDKLPTTADTINKYRSNPKEQVKIEAAHIAHAKVQADFNLYAANQPSDETAECLL